VRSKAAGEKKEGEKRIKSIGKINIPQEAFIQVLRAQ
jgi:translation elongation factor EF-4